MPDRLFSFLSEPIWPSASSLIQELICVSQSWSALGPVKPAAPLARDSFVLAPLLLDFSLWGLGSCLGPPQELDTQFTNRALSPVLLLLPPCATCPSPTPHLMPFATHTLSPSWPPFSSNVFLICPGTVTTLGFPAWSNQLQLQASKSPGYVTQRLAWRWSDCRERCVFLPASVFFEDNGQLSCLSLAPLLTLPHTWLTWSGCLRGGEEVKSTGWVHCSLGGRSCRKVCYRREDCCCFRKSGGGRQDENMWFS